MHPRVAQGAAMAALLLLAACGGGKGRAFTDYTSLAPDEKMYYGTLSYMPEVKGGQYDGQAHDRAFFESPNSPDLVQGYVGLCVRAQFPENNGCRTMFKSQSWLDHSGRDVQASGALNLDGHDVFAFRAKQGETLYLSDINVAQNEYHLETPIALQGNARVNYIGNIVVRLQQRRDTSFFALNLAAHDYYTSSAAMAYQELKIPMNVPSSVNVLKIGDLKYSSSRTVETQRPVYIYMPKYKPR